MRRRVPGCGVVVCAAAVAVAHTAGRAADAIPWRAARAHVGDVVTVEGDVVRARLEAGTCVLEFAPDDPTAFRVVLLIPLMSDLPREPQRLYEGKRIRASGRVRSWRGRPEMILRGPDAIEVVGVGASPEPGAPAAATPTTSPRAPAPTAPPRPLPAPPPAPAPTAPAAPPPTTLPPAAAVPPTVAPAPPPPTTIPPPAAPAPRSEDEPLRLPARVDPCEAARARWRAAAATAETRAAALTACLRAGDYRCRAAGAALAPALSELEWSEQQIEAACP